MYEKSCPNERRLTADLLLITEAKLTADSLISTGLTLCGQGADSEKKKWKKQHQCTHIKNWIIDVNEYEKVKLQEKIIENSAKEEVE